MAAQDYELIQRNPKYRRLVISDPCSAGRFRRLCWSSISASSSWSPMRRNSWHADGLRRHDDRHSDRPGGYRLGFHSHRHLCAARQRDLRQPDPRNRRGVATDVAAQAAALCDRGFLAALPAAFRLLAHAAGAVEGGTQQATNWHAIVMFVAVRRPDARHHLLGGQADQIGGAVLCRRRRHHRLPERPRHRRRLHVGGLASSASRASSICSGFDGLIYSIGWLVGWPIVTFLIAEPLRNLGKFTFADVVVVPPAADAGPHRSPRCGTLVTVGLLPDRADGRRRQARSSCCSASTTDRGGDRRRR